MDQLGAAAEALALPLSLTQAACGALKLPFNNAAALYVYMYCWYACLGIAVHRTHRVADDNDDGGGGSFVVVAGLASVGRFAQRAISIKKPKPLRSALIVCKQNMCIYTSEKIAMIEVQYQSVLDLCARLRCAKLSLLCLQ